MTILFLVGRIILGGYFLMSGFDHFQHLTMMSGYAKSKGVPAASFAVGFSGVLLLLGGLSVVLGAYPTVGLWLLVIFLVPVSIKMHNFWTIADPTQKMGEMINFTKNMALVGAILMLLAMPHPWILSII